MEKMALNNENKVISGQEEIDKIISSPSGRAGVNWIIMIYFLSGACSLIDEVIWVRLLKLTLGNTVYASSIVVSMFMGGLALGALIMSRFCDRVSRRLRLYALLETLITISALAIPFVLKAADNIYVWFYRSHHPDNSQLLIVQVIVSAAILLVPSILMGSTLPLLGRFVTAFEKEAGHLVGRLYALNTLGAATGCFLAGFFLIRDFGVMGSLYIAAALNLVVAFGGWYLSRNPDILSYETAEDEVFQKVEASVVNKPDGKFYILVAAFFMSGLISIGYELLWMRSIVHLLCGFTYVFSSVLTVYLLGNVIGTAIGSGLVKTLKIPAAGFAITLFLLGLCGIFYLPVMILWSSRLMPWINEQVELTSNIIPFSTFLAKPLIQSMFLFLIPAIIMGIGFPIALQAWTNHVHKVGKSTGTAYAANTIGAVVGGIVVGFVFIPLGGLQLSIILLGLAGIWVAGIMYLSFAGYSLKITRFALIAVAVVFTIIAASMPSDLFETVVASNPELLKELKLLDIKEGVTTTASVLRDMEDDTLYLYTSGQRVAGDTYFWRGDQKMLGHFGILLKKNAKKALSVGFGSGESTACFALHDLERADCVEIAPEMVQFSLKYFRHINLGDRLNDEINMIYMDAKNYIHLTDIKYDAIINDSIHPRAFADNASLYTKEYYESCRDHLTENGLFLSWIPTNNVEAVDVMNSIMGTMMDVFPYVTIWYMTPEPAYYFLMVCSSQPQYFSPKYIDDELGKKGVHDSLSLININNSMDIMSCYIGDKEDLERNIKSHKINSDYSPFIEFSTENYWVAGNDAYLGFIRDVRSDSVFRHIDWDGFSQEQKQKWISQFGKLYEASTCLIMTISAGNSLEALKLSMKGLSIIPDNPALLDTRLRLEQTMFSQCTRFIDGNVPQAALAQSDEMIKIDRKSAIGWLIRSAALEKMNEIQQAYDAAERAVSLEPNLSDSHMQMGFVMLGKSQYEQAINEFNEALRLGEKDRYFFSKKRIRTLNALSEIYSNTGDIPQAIEKAQAALILAKTYAHEESAAEIQKRIDSLKTKIKLGPF